MSYLEAQDAPSLILVRYFLESFVSIFRAAYNALVQIYCVQRKGCYLKCRQ
jgi:hypothetical protein